MTEKSSRLKIFHVTHIKEVSVRSGNSLTREDHLETSQVPLTDLSSPARGQRLHGLEDEEEERSLWSAQPRQNHAASRLPFT
ncbi:uncharacterized protein PADG_11581 [Paracoccidioides brasiliensis Pb18]|uniref:Uncharacterized protein n=1 Tax=Paracoccidioides brasiliensis (strain Pb18) TaxID=502780 RepID=A0A0A0HWE4_PARBD|nr:uncharacterized protein PADG_11581 [Paracoccidioides brasiliensis Pb18]KGM92381.1 hypothetical protein PADG_11581 [Paracoccidioides brasiliensis Pb18]ODH45780.1 hypothetical protein GX48_08145 [Paracoccidioides brasiliensis]